MTSLFDFQNNKTEQCLLLIKFYWNTIQTFTSNQYSKNMKNRTYQGLHCSRDKHK